MYMYRYIPVLLLLTNGVETKEEDFEIERELTGIQGERDRQR